MSTLKKSYTKGDIIEVTMKDIYLKSANAPSFVLLYNTSFYKFIGMENLNIKGMENLTQDPFHSNKEIVSYPTFIN